MKISLALGGGAGLGWAHIGVIHALEEQGITISAIAGTSIGAIVGACYAAGKLEALEDVARSTSIVGMLRYIDPHWKRGGIIGGKQIERRLTEHLGEPDFADLSIPVATVSADLITGKTVIMREGPVLPAVRSSMSLPGIFPPVERDGMVLVDGGACMPVPVRPARELAPGLPCVAVSLQSDYVRRAEAAGIGDESSRRPGSVAVVKASVGLSLANLARYSLERDPPDLLLPLRVGHIDIQDFTKADELIAIGHDEAQNILEKLPLAT
ncbi:patatin-like phospholipase family protein [Alterisphingorhabdus coralli]|uniref:Patatin-like phospholipase family protein n=1 Tax=Alterisphingorhabdus coralli TaxID=3071408 RepID=A0AA97F6K7_9SPHN|nr:patatin-like phospholipase family protein [Parasphingorhabdus sp. SCSIO 66989]WOE75146.1 patatin-like phospholipase family protein [Parasphingorhabdus sp. SCSIO 66989]